MIVLVLGTPDSGKSEKAESLVMELSCTKEEQRYYIATMIPFGEEGKKRVQKHRQMREGKGFVTIECPVKITEALGKISSPNMATCLLECMSNLIGNEMHDAENQHQKDDMELCALIVDEVMSLAGCVRNLVVVSNSFPLQDEGYDEDTRRYVQLVDMVNKELKQRVDKVYEILK